MTSSVLTLTLAIIEACLMNLERDDDDGQNCQLLSLCRRARPAQNRNKIFDLKGILFFILGCAFDPTNGKKVKKGGEKEARAE